MKRLFVVTALVTLAGCASIDLSNRASCTVGGDRVLITSMWQWFGISTELDKRDAAAILKGCKP